MRPAEEVLGAVGFSVLSVRPGDTCVTMGVSDLPVVAPSIYLSADGERMCCSSYLNT